MSSTTPPGRWRHWLLQGLVFIAAFVVIQLWQARDAARGAAPNFSGQLLDGRTFDLAVWQQRHPGQPLLIHFWATWCPVCKATAGSTNSIANDWPLISIASQSGSAAQVTKTMTERGYDWPTLNDPQGQLMQQYGLRGVPAFIVLDPKGDIRFVSLGYTSEIALRLRLWWASQEKT